ncbi:MAG: c-type cytochrome [Sphingobacteriales bacterium]|nr:c-type cytochrome [Sphingobacteriales bacterium]OJY91925.1 MAG: hypothetical protein BGP14_23685 [Sphingobacteriales bacterium 44-15]
MKITYITTGLLLLLSSCEQKRLQSPIEPQEVLSTFQLPEGYRIELVASEPLVTNPVEAVFDEDGRMYVAQMDDYPSDKMDDYSAGYEPKSKIMRLEDKDGDGFYESGTVFADGLSYANGVMPWKGGVLVTSAPDILFLKDTDGDGKADVKQVVLTGFAKTNPQLRMGSLRYGLDNWIYGAYSHTGGGDWRKEFKDKGNPLQFPEKPELNLEKIFPGANFRFQPDAYKLESSGGMSQFGLSFDASGNQFTVWNNNHIRHVVINNRYLSNNPFLSIKKVMEDISDHEKAATVYPITQVKYLREDEVGHFTSACGVCAYTGGLFGGKYAHASFVCEPVSNLVHADILTTKGATFSAARAEKGKEFLASSDSWFRPVNTTIGPDGALYVVDFYRKLVEHPDWIGMTDSSGFYTHAGKIKESDFLEGNDRGRIYRIVPKTYKSGDQEKNGLSKADTKTLVAYLNDPNSWWRLNAQRLLVDRKDQSAVPLIRDYLSISLRPEGKIHGLWTLEALGGLDDSLLTGALQDADAMVREQAVLLAERRMDNKTIFQHILQAASDNDPHVQFQVALTLSNAHTTSPEVFQALSGIINTRIEDPWFQTAVLLGASENSNQWFAAYKDFAAATDSANLGKKEFLKKASSIAGARYKTDEMSALVKIIASAKDTGVVASGLKGMTTGMKSNTNKTGLTPEGQQGLITLINDPLPAVKKAAIEAALELNLVPSAELGAVLNSSKTIAGDDKASAENRALAIQILGLDPKGLPFSLLGQLLGTGTAAEVQLAAADMLLRSREEPATRLLLSNWEALSPRVHEKAEAGFLSNRERLAALLKEIENNKISPERISRNMQNRLTRYSDTAISAKARELFKNVGSREKVILEYNESTTVSGDREKGKAVFLKTCSVCHSLEGAGANFGPDLHSVSHQTKINLLTMILNPNKDIAAGYEGYIIEKTDGMALAGIVSNENDNSLLLRMQGGTEQTIVKSDIRSMTSMPISLMPEGLEASINKEEMADLLEYIKTLK